MVMHTPLIDTYTAYLNFWNALEVFLTMGFTCPLFLNVKFQVLSGKIAMCIIRSQEKNLNQNRDSNLKPPDF